MPNDPKKSPNPKKKQKPERRRPAGSTILVANTEHRWRMFRRRSAWGAAFSVGVVALVLVVAYASYWYVSRFAKEKPILIFMSEGTIVHSLGARGFVAREETVESLSNEGLLLPVAVEGSRVAKEENLAMIVPESQLEAVSELQNLRQSIVQLQNDLLNQGKGSDAKRIFEECDSQILPIINQIRDGGSENRSENTQSHISAIQIILEKRDAQLGDVDFNDSQLSALLDSKDQLQTALSIQSDRISSPVPGIVSYKSDSLDKELSVSSLETLSIDKAEEIIRTAKPRMEDFIQDAKRQIRICENNIQYIGVVLNKSDMGSFFPSEGEKYDLAIAGEGVELPSCTVDRVDFGSDKVLVVFSTTKMVERLLDLRIVDVDILLNPDLPELEEGKTRLKIALTALLDDKYETTGIGEIFLNVSGYAQKYPVKIIDYDREYAIIESIKGNVPNTKNILISNPRSVEEEQKVE